MKILILSGTHGNEMSAVQAGLLLKQYYSEDDSVTVIPFLNKPGLIGNSRTVIQSSTLDLNRSFKSKENMDYSKIVSDIKDLVEQYDYVIDIHNSYRCSNFCLIDMGKNDELIQSICYLSDVEYATRYSKGGTIKDYVNSNNGIGITYEFSGMQTLNSEKELIHAINDIKNIVTIIKRKDEEEVLPFESNDQELYDLHCLKSGFINFVKDINDIAMPEEVVFEVIDSDGEVIETVCNNKTFPIKLMAIGHSFQEKGSSVLQYINKDI